MEWEVHAEALALGLGLLDDGADDPTCSGAGAGGCGDGQHDAYLQHGTDECRPCEGFGQSVRSEASSEEESGDLAQIPHRWCGEWEKEPPVTVQYAQKPRADYQHPGHREQNSDQSRGEIPGRFVRRNQQDRRYPWGENDAERTQQEGGDGHYAEHGTGQAMSVLVADIRAGQRLAVDGNEGGRQRAFAEQVPDDVRNLDRRPIGICGELSSEECSDGDVPDESCDPAQENPRSNRCGGTRRSICHGSGRWIDPVSRISWHGVLWSAVTVGNIIRLEQADRIGFGGGALQQRADEPGLFAQAFE